MNDKKNQKYYLFWNIIQKLTIATFGVCVAYLCVSSAIYRRTMPIKDIESLWGPARCLPHTPLVLGGAILSVVMIFISTKMKNKN